MHSICFYTFFCLSNLLYLFSDENECLTGSHDCDMNANCVNTYGSYTCHCETGFLGNGVVCSGKRSCFIFEFLL